MNQSKEFKQMAHRLGYHNMTRDQVDAIKALRNGQDYFLIAAPAQGKSGIFHGAALLDESRLVLVIEPTISLIMDQVNRLSSLEEPVSAEYMTYHNRNEHVDILSRVAKGKVTILFATPERLQKDYFRKAISKNEPWLVVVDECHLAVHWGRTFRTDYLKIGEFVDRLKHRPVLLVPSNTARRASPPKVPKHELDTFEADEVKEILSALQTEPLKWQVITMLLIGTGARRGEIMGLQWKHIDFEKNRLYLCKNRVYTRRTGAISTTLKTDESRYVTISPAITGLMRQWKEEQATFFAHLGVTPSDYIATADNGEPMHPDSPTDWLSKFSRRHSLPPIHPHKFRHTQASLLIAEGVDILTVSKRLGHAKVSTTLDIYSHVLAKSDQQASNALDNLLFQKKEG